MPAFDYFPGFYPLFAKIYTFTEQSFHSEGSFQGRIFIGMLHLKCSSYII